MLPLCLRALAAADRVTAAVALPAWREPHVASTAAKSLYIVQFSLKGGEASSLRGSGLLLAAFAVRAWEAPPEDVAARQAAAKLAELVRELCSRSATECLSNCRAASPQELKSMAQYWHQLGLMASNELVREASERHIPQPREPKSVEHSYERELSV